MHKYILFLILFTFLSLSPISSSPRIISQTKELMGTVSEIQVFSKNTDGAEKAIEEAFWEMKRVESVFSLWIPESELCKINRTAFEKPIKVNPLMEDLLKKSLQISQETEGAFDLTIMPLAMLWKKSFKEEKIPNSNRIANLKALVNYKNVRLDNEGRVFFLRKGMKLDFGGIAKGYAVDRAARTLRKRGFKNFIVGISGDLFVSGHKSLKKWKIGIRHPRIEGELIETLNIQNRAVSTSGDYEQYLDQGARRYHHLLDPKTGYPARNCISVTVLAPTSTLADAYSTAFFILGPEKTKQFIQKHSELKAIMIVKSKGKLEKLEFGK